VIQLPVLWGEMDAYRHVQQRVYFRYSERRLEYFRRLDWFEFERQTGSADPPGDAGALRGVDLPDTIRSGRASSTLGDDRFTLEH